MTSYYNELDPKAAATLRELIKEGLIAPGDVDERSIEDVRPAELVGYTQCHFFAGFGIWSLALRRAGWPDDREAWTGSCPCQPFSAAGKGDGFADERHLWPAFHWLIGQRNPPVVFGEQVAGKDANAWIDLVQADLEAMGFAFGALAFPAASIGAPNIRDRTYWLADADNTRLEGWAGVPERAYQRPAGARGLVEWLADSGRSNAGREAQSADHHRQEGDRSSGGACRCGGASCGMAHTESDGHEWSWRLDESTGRHGIAHGGSDGERTRPVNGFWRAADWLLCRDGKWRPVEPGTFPLAHGYPQRVGLLRGAGNAINAYAAQAFIEATGLVRQAA